MNAPALSRTAQSCEEFESAVSAFVDGELAQLDHDRVIQHLDACAPCRRFAQTLKSLVAVHRDAESVDRLIDELDPQRHVAEIARRLLAENLEKLAGICYELGKSYLLAGSGRGGVVLLKRRPLPIPRLKSRGRTLNHEAIKLAASAGMTSPLGLPRKRGLIDAPLSACYPAHEPPRGYSSA